jgi:hypothetical protein
MTTYGTLEWARTTHGGRLGSVERAKQMAEAVKFQMAQRLRGQLKEVGASSAAQIELMMKEIELPNTELIRKATDVITEAGPREVLTHSLRVWAWAALFAVRDGRRDVDREALAVAALLHDLGLARRSDHSLSCFAVDSATQTESLLEDWGASKAFGEKVAEAICLHLRVAVPIELGVEAHLIHAGAAADVIGSGLNTIPTDVRAKVFEKYARGDFAGVFSKLLLEESKAHPDSRAALWVSLGFVDRIRKAVGGGGAGSSPAGALK